MAGFSQEVHSVRIRGAAVVAAAIQTLGERQRAALAALPQGVTVRDRVRASLEINNRKGALASLFNRIVEAGGSVVTVSSFPATSPTRIRIILKVADVSQEALRSLLKPEETVFDVREIGPEHYGSAPAPDSASGR